MLATSIGPDAASAPAPDDFENVPASRAPFVVNAELNDASPAVVPDPGSRDPGEAPLVSRPEGDVVGIGVGGDVNATGLSKGGAVVVALASPVVVLRGRCSESTFGDFDDVPAPRPSRCAPEVTSVNTLENGGLS
ncbi:MAG TPA: hypothetical protein VGZ04_10765 [Acidimicrobiales bacterium]|nr:hypothetical protein [Acidimicrobiales bacterium]